MTASPQTDTPINKDLSPLHALMESTWNIAQKMLADGEQEIMPQFAAEVDGALLLYMTPWGDEEEKSAALVFLRKEFAERGVQRYVMLSEAWAIKREGEYDNSIAPSEAPDRIEVVQVLGVDPGAGEVMSFQAEIHTDGTGRRLGEREVMEYGAGVGGRMVELLGPIRRATVN